MTFAQGSRSISRGVYRLLISPRFAFWLLLAWALLLAVWVVPFTVAGQSEETVGAIATDWFALKVIYWSVGVSTILCSLARFRRDLRRSRSRTVPARVHTMVSGVRMPGLRGIEGLSRHLQRAGFEVFTENGALWAVRGRYRVLWGSVFHLALLLLVASWLFFGSTVNTGGMELIEGQSADEFFASTAVRPDTVPFVAALSGFKLISVSPRFFDEYFLFERLDATAQWRGKERRFSLSRPLWLSPVSYVSIQDFNYAPRVVARDASGKVLDDAVSSMKLFPPGSEDVLDMPSAKISLGMVVHSDYRVIAGTDGSRSYNLANPRVQITVLEVVGGVPQQRVLARKLVELGEPIVLPDGTTVTVEEIRHVGTFRLVSAPWMPAVAISALLIAISLAGRLLRPRLDVIARLADGVLLVDARLDSVGGDAGIERLRMILGQQEEMSQ